MSDNSNILNLINNINSKIDNNEPIVAYKNNDNNTIESILVHPEDIENIVSVSEDNYIVFIKDGKILSIPYNNINKIIKECDNNKDEENENNIIYIKDICINKNNFNYLLNDIKNCKRRYYFTENCDDEFKKIVKTIYNYKIPYFERYNLIYAGYCLDLGVEDTIYNIRLSVAEKGYGLDKLINDESWMVRTAVARQGYGLNKLIKDHSANVRKAVKNQGYYSFKNIIKRFINKLFSYEDKNDYIDDNNYTDYNYIDPKIALLMIDNLSENNTENIRDLINCDDPYIRSMVAMKGYALDILVYDKDWRVREAVASTTTNLDLLNILLNDNDESVIKSAIKTVDKIHNYYINKN